MNQELVERHVLAQRAVKDLIASFPKGKQSYMQVTRHVNLSSSVHLTWLMRDDHLTPTMERALVMANLIPSPPDPVLVHPCEVCGEVHKLEWCANMYGEPKKPKTTQKQRSKRKPRPPRFEVAAYDLDLALKQLERHYPGQFLNNAKQGNAEADTPFDEVVDQFDKDLGKAMEIVKRLT